MIWILVSVLGGERWEGQRSGRIGIWMDLPEWIRCTEQEHLIFYVNVLHTTSTMEELLKNQIRMTQPVEVIKLCSSTTPVLDYGHMNNGYMAGISSFQFRSVAQLCLTLCDPMNCSMPGLPVHHQLPEFTQTHVHPVSDAIQPSHPL